MEDTKKIRPLEKEINDKKTAFESSASEDKKQKYAEGIAAVVATNIVGKALQVGETAINFTLPNALGKKITLFDALENGPVILMWYRGGWCPYCNMQLHYMQEALPEFKKLGASLLAITPETPDNSISTKEKNNLEFEVLSDVDNVVGFQYKVVFKLTDDVKEIYENGFGLSNFNGNDKGELPLAATYIIGQDKVIQYAFLDADYRNRAEPQDLLEHLK
ncbi:alkyl hydroperoxide reductase/ Thiol specific antioxidant/ Mal allergen [Cellulophaga algicola DSM 14237]|uniref:thioredoxin-dependent peroxiredoxin n=1 Tax=Cellulophaga algicola (strain DSM 14237 / IC166 / ACAM 630) TaxID=688270 RepID=E6XF51_CELAD|nr:peroxiredoxin-like family protein [Cellulophaga algicola]ADV50287.1 alkyl hydroperoxide reductase/ Thiol specific antioxidant/ Mal allergen [Cellulophaga algicola DSM 14237]